MLIDFWDLLRIKLKNEKKFINLMLIMVMDVMVNITIMKE